jgi:hypothetical protein
MFATFPSGRAVYLPNMETDSSAEKWALVTAYPAVYSQLFRSAPKSGERLRFQRLAFSKFSYPSGCYETTYVLY